MRSIQQSRIRELLAIDADSGHLFWLKPTSVRVKVGDRAGSPHIEGYRAVGIDGVSLLEHRVVWVHVNGEIPDGFDVDHINRVRTDNRPCNLRLVSRTENLHNSDGRKNSTGLAGVALVPSGRFVAGIHVKRVRQYIGTFDTAEEAHEAYTKRHIELYGETSKFHPNHVFNR